MAQISQCPLYDLGGSFLRFALLLLMVFEIAILSCEGVPQTHTAVGGNKEGS